MPITDTARVVSFDFNADTALLSLFIQVERDDGLGDALSTPKRVSREFNFTLDDLEAINATHAGQNLNGRQWLIGARKAIIAALQARLAASSDAISNAAKAIPAN